MPTTRTPSIALSIADLASLMIDAAARAKVPELRYHGETDAVLLGKMSQLEAIASGVWRNNLYIGIADYDTLTLATRRMRDSYCDLSALVNHQA